MDVDSGEWAGWMGVAKRIRNVLGEGLDKPSALNILGSVLLVSVPTLSLLLMAIAYEGKSVREGVAYALQETSNLRSSIERFYTVYGSLPPDAVTLGVALETPYPDGGYYRLEKDGMIKIGFSTRPALKDGSIMLKPSLDGNGGVQWECLLHGDLAQYVPSACRY